MATHITIVKNDIDRVTNEVIKRASDAVNRIGHDGADRMDEEVPVATGNLKDHTGYRSTGEANGELYSETDYAQFVNDGTVHMPPRPYFTHAVENAKRDIADTNGHIFDGLP